MSEQAAAWAAHKFGGDGVAHALSIGLIGPGSVGSTFLNQLSSQAERLERDFNLGLRVRGVASSKRMALFDSGADLADWRAAVESAAKPVDMELSRSRACRTPSAQRDHRLFRQRGGRPPLSGIFRARHPRGHRQQESAQR
jgi:hypothetical protein